MVLHPVARKRLKRLINEEWNNRADPEGVAQTFRSTVAEADSTFELFALVALFNWEEHWHLLRSVLAHPRCDKGTALLAYWACNPSFLYRRMEKRQPFDADQQVRMTIVKDLENAIAGNRYAAELVAVDPNAVFGKPIRDDDPANPGLRLIPAAMKQRTGGEPIDIKKVHAYVFEES